MMTANEDNIAMARLRSMKILAAALLVGMGVLYCISIWLESSQDLWGYVKAFSEAAMVGALADWFAVTALFRHPLGLPIPHTAIIPNNKNRMGEGLATFVVSHFLTEDNLTKELRKIDFSEKILAKVLDENNRDLLIRELTSWIPTILRAFDDEHIERFIRETFASRARQIDLSSAFANFLDILTENDRHEPVIIDMLQSVKKMLIDNQKTLDAQARDRIPIPEVLNLFDIKTRLAHLFSDFYLNEIGRALDAASADPSHFLRAKIRDKIKEFKINLRTSGELKQKIEKFKEDLINNKNLQEYLGGLWEEIRILILKDLESPSSKIREQLGNVALQLGDALRRDIVLQERLNTFIRNNVAAVLYKERDRIGSVITTTFHEWTPTAVSERIELTIGRDLQWIRVNGTIVGGLVGLLIFVVTKMAR